MKLELCRAAEHPLLVNNDAPGNNREQREEQKNYLCGRARPCQQPDDAGGIVGRGVSLGLQEQGKGHPSKRAQPGLRNIAVRRWDSAMVHTIAHAPDRCQTYVTIGVRRFSMLRFLKIGHLAVIDAVEVEFEPGLNVLTGETGAGKSILVEAVGLLLGGRASADLVRTGEDAATIEAIFDAGGEELVVRREITAQGRSRAFVNGALATAAVLRDLSSRL